MAAATILLHGMNSLGIDVCGSSVKLACVQSDGQVLFQAQSETYARPGRDELTEVIRRAIAGRFDGRNGAVGICVPGLRERGGHVVLKSVNLTVLDGLNLDDLIKDALGGEPAHIEVMTDAVASAFDIYATGNLAGRLCALALGTGIGAGVLDDGQPLHVDGESPGHLGQMDVSIEGEPVIGPDGGAGSLEGYLGAPAIVKRYGADMAQNLSRFTSEDPPMKALARAIRICHAMYCPHHVALLGGVGIRMQHLVPTIRAMVEKDLTRIARPGWTLVCGTDDFHAARGAARFAQRAAQQPR
jgi:predicted NBD/HSP70 family sugar kinase